MKVLFFGIELKVSLFFLFVLLVSGDANEPFHFSCSLYYQSRGRFVSLPYHSIHNFLIVINVYYYYVYNINPIDSTGDNAPILKIHGQTLPNSLNQLICNFHITGNSGILRFDMIRP